MEDLLPQAHGLTPEGMGGPRLKVVKGRRMKLSMLWPGGERLNLRGWLGLCIGMAGVLLLFMPRFHDNQPVLADPGPFLVLGSAACWALGRSNSAKPAYGIPRSWDE